MKILISILALATTLAAYDHDSRFGQNLTKKISQIKKEVAFIEPLRLKERLEFDASGRELFILDVREGHEVEHEGSIKAERFVNIPRGLVEFKIEDNVPDLSSEIVVVCFSELRSVFVAKRLAELGYSNVKVMKGGMDRWNRECLPKEDTNNLFFQERVKSGCGEGSRKNGETPALPFMMNGSFEK